MEAVYTLFDVERAVPEVYVSIYDARVLASQIPLDMIPVDVPERIKEQFENSEPLGWQNDIAAEELKRRGIVK